MGNFDIEMRDNGTGDFDLSLSSGGGASSGNGNFFLFFDVFPVLSLMLFGAILFV